MIPEDAERQGRKAREEAGFFAVLAGFAFPIGFAVLFLALHLPYLPPTLEDHDSINFALGIRAFDVARHQPHPPGYPVFIAIAKAVHRVVPSETATLALLSVFGGALGVIAIAALFRRLDGDVVSARWPVAAAGVAMATPLYWFTAVRPLSDASGLAAAVAVQAMILAAASPRALAVAAFCAGLSAGLRSQVVWLTVPLLLYQGLRAQGSGLKRSERPLALSPKLLALVSLAFAAGALLWFAPLVILSGGPGGYWRALFDQGAEDLGNIQMLWNNHTPRDLMDALDYAFIAPWGPWPLAAVVLSCAAAGLVALAVNRRRALLLLVCAFGPYFVFDLLFQETFTSRYALPLVVPIAYLAVAGLRLMPWDSGLAGVVAIAMFSAHVGGTSIAAYSHTPAPAFRLLDAMKTAASGAEPVVAMDRREALDLRAPLKFLGTAPWSRQLPAPPQHEWLEAVKYWNSGGRAPVWFVVDPRRASIDLVQHGEPRRYEWQIPYPALLGGVRPNDMDWYTVERPDWYVGEGWALTPEAAGVAASDRRGLSQAPIQAWINPDIRGGWLMIGGRSLDAARHPQLTVRVNGRSFLDAALAPGAFLLTAKLPDDVAALTESRGYAAVTVEATPRANVAVEQFDASLTRPVLGLGDGWHEQEYDPVTGRRWRWLSEHGELRVRMPLKRISFDRSEAPALVLHIEGESPLTYFPRGSTLTVRSGTRVLLTRLLNADFALDLPIGSAGVSGSLGLGGDPGITLETDQVFSPADRSWRRSADRRHLGLRIFKAELRAMPVPRATP